MLAFITSNRARVSLDWEVVCLAFMKPWVYTIVPCKPATVVHASNSNIMDLEAGGYRSSLAT